MCNIETSLTDRYGALASFWKLQSSFGATAWKRVTNTDFKIAPFKFHGKEKVNVLEQHES